ADVSQFRLGKEVVLGEEGTSVSFKQQKTASRKTAAWPQHLEEALSRYLDLYRPLLSRGNHCDAIWLSRKTGRRLSRSQIGRAVSTLSLRLTGRAVSPHFVRNCFMTSVAEEAPEHLDSASLHLGHSDARSREPY